MKVPKDQFDTLLRKMVQSTPEKSRIFLFLFPFWCGDTRCCEYCAAVAPKAAMQHYDGYGWFCDDDEFESYWSASAV